MPAPRCCPSAAVAVANLVAEAAHGKPAVLGFKSHKKTLRKNGLDSGNCTWMFWTHRLQLQTEEQTNVIMHQAWIVYPHFGMQQINKQLQWGQWGKQKTTNLSFCLSLKSGLSVSINLHAGFHLNPLKKIFVLQTSWLFTHKFCCIKKNNKNSKLLNQQKPTINLFTWWPDVHLWHQLPGLGDWWSGCLFWVNFKRPNPHRIWVRK